MKKYATQAKSRLIPSSRIQLENSLTPPYCFKSKLQQQTHLTKQLYLFKQNNTISSLNHLNYEQKRLYYKDSLKQLIRKWFDYQKNKIQQAQISNSNDSCSQKQLFNGPVKKYSPIYMSSPLDQIKINDQSNVNQFVLSHYKRNTSQLIKQQVSEDIISFLYQNHPLLQKINYNLVQTLINIGVFTKYNKGDQIKYVYYSQKHKMQALSNKRLGIILYGQLKLYNKISNFQFKLNEQDTLGQHSLQSLEVIFQQYRNVNVKVINQQTVILWIRKEHYEILFKQSMKCGLKQEIKKLQGHLKINWIKKGIKKFY